MKSKHAFIDILLSLCYQKQTTTGKKNIRKTNVITPQSILDKTKIVVK